DRRTGRSHDSQSRRVNRPGHHRADRVRGTEGQREGETERKRDRERKRPIDTLSVCPSFSFLSVSPSLCPSVPPSLPSLRLHAAFASAASDKILSAHRYFIAGWLIETLSPLRPLSIEIFDPISRA